MSDAEDDLEILDVSPRPVSSEVAVSSGSSRRNGLFLGAAVVVALVVGVSLITGSGESAAPEVDPSVEEGGEGESEDAVGDEPDEVADGSADDSAADDAEPDEVIGVGTSLEPVAPLLTASGLTLYGQRDTGAGSGMVGIDLDAGDVTNFGYPYDEVLLQSDAYLIVRNTAGERHSAISLATPTTAPQVVSQNTWVVAAREEGGEHVVAFLTRVETDETLRYTEMTIDLDIGTIIFRGTLRDTHPFISQNPLSTDTALFTGPTGGIYEPRGPNFEQVFDGRVLGFDDEFAIVERCDDSLECTVDWVQRGDWATVDRPLPDRQFEHAEVLGGGRILVVRERIGGDLSLFNVDANTMLDMPVRSIGDVAVSPDGSMLAVAMGRDVVLVDIDSGAMIGSPLSDLQGPLVLAATP